MDGGSIRFVDPHTNPAQGLNFPHLAASLLQQPDQQELARSSAPGHAIAPAAAGAAQQQQNGGMSSAVAQQEDGGGTGNPYFQDEEALFETPQYVRNMAAGMMMSPRGPAVGRLAGPPDVVRCAGIASGATVMKEKARGNSGCVLAGCAYICTSVMVILQNVKR
uniref:Uncharacterized protein n=1 Tax=Saccharum hybrid cultivar R570 TaxID=131158 RepID=A0A059Q2V5_9POAL|nr:hypothetical protein SHCRBa_010_E09_F_440 [Saccharum hybrid cultivar R570]